MSQHYLRGAKRRCTSATLMPRGPISSLEEISLTFLAVVRSISWFRSVQQLAWRSCTCSVPHPRLHLSISITTVTLIILCLYTEQIHLMTFQGTRYCAKDPSLVTADEVKAARGELEPPRGEKSEH